jgi:hypothetical protein
MHKPYTYLIGWSKLNLFYYGVRFSRNCCPDDLWKTYFTSSKYVKEYRKLYGEPDIKSIKKIFKNKQDAMRWESKVLKRIKAHTNPKFINKSNNTCADNSKEHYDKLSILFKDKKRDAVIGKKISDKFTDKRKEISKTTRQKYGSAGVYEITFPNGNVQIITHMKIFCKEHNLSPTSMASLVNNKYPCDTYKGYRAKKIGNTYIIRTH